MNAVKKEFLFHFKAHFSLPTQHRIHLGDPFPSRLSELQIWWLEEDVIVEEIKRVVWDWGSDKSPGPNGFTFEIFWKFWHVVGTKVVEAVREFFLLRLNFLLVAIYPLLL